MKQWLGVMVLSLSFLLFGCSAETEGEKKALWSQPQDKLQMRLK